MKAGSAVVIRPSIRPALVAHARQASPAECCGLLVGDGRQVQHAVPTPNTATGPGRYRVDERFHIELRRLLRKLVPKASVVGAYHSHPAGSAWPSTRDVEESFSRDWLHVIVGLGARRPIVRAFRIVDGNVRPVSIAWRRHLAAETARPQAPRS